VKTSRVLLAALAGCAISTSAHAIVVQTELSLLCDVSGSITTAEFNLQRDGYRNAFLSAAVQNKVAQAAGGIAVNMVMWSGAGQQQQVVTWTHLQNAADCIAFANLINGVARPYSGSTAPGEAIRYASNNAFGGVASIFNNGFEGSHLILDVSGDGAQNAGAINTNTARDAALAAGVDRINGLVILGEAGVQTWYQNNVIGGTGAFLEVATGFADFERAITNKIEQELVVIPLPSMAGLTCAGLGILAIRRRRAV